MGCIYFFKQGMFGVVPIHFLLGGVIFVYFFRQATKSTTLRSCDQIQQVRHIDISGHINTLFTYRQITWLRINIT